jgi:hypothetical protein
VVGAHHTPAASYFGGAVEQQQQQQQQGTHGSSKGGGRTGGSGRGGLGQSRSSRILPRDNKQHGLSSMQAATSLYQHLYQPHSRRASRAGQALVQSKTLRNNAAQQCDNADSLTTGSSRLACQVNESRSYRSPTTRPASQRLPYSSDTQQAGSVLFLLHPLPVHKRQDPHRTNKHRIACLGNPVTVCLDTIQSDCE